MNVLAIGAHPDDIELGCGGTLAAHRRAGDGVAFLVLTSGEQGPQAARSRVLEQENATAIIDADLYWGGIEDCAVTPDRNVIDLIQAVMRDVRPDTVYTHAPRDSHQDHRNASAATLSAARRSARILYYESPTSLDFRPSLYTDVGLDVDTKLRMIAAHCSQVLRNGLVDIEAIEAQARFRGFQARLHHAEAFEPERFVWDLSGGRPALDLVAAELEGALS